MSTDYLMATSTNETLAYSAMMCAISARNSIKAARKMSGDKLRDELHHIKLSRAHVVKCAQILTQRSV